MRPNKQPLVVQRAVLETLERRRLLSFAAPVSYTVGTNPTAVATGNFNGDGHSDVVTANAIGNNVSVLLSNANGSLQTAQQFATGSGPRNVAVGDLNNDGNQDLVTANGGGDVSVLLGKGNGTFQSPLSVTLPTQMPSGYTGTTPLEQLPLAVAVGDMNADGKLDLVVNGQTSFPTSITSPGGPTWYFDQIDSYVNVLLGNGNGTFANAHVHAASAAFAAIDVGDFNNDNKLDVVTGSDAPAVWLGNGNGTLQQPPLGNSAYGQSLAVGDFDMDGKRDLAAGSGAMGSGEPLTFLKGLGNGGMQSPVRVPVVGSSRSLVAGDVNGDGKLDLVVSTTRTTYEYYSAYYNGGPETTEYTKALLGKGDGTFERGVSSTLGKYPDPAYLASFSNASALGDFNGDSRPDLVATDPRTGKIYQQLNEVGWVIPGTLEISDAAPVTEGNTGTVNAVFTATLAEAPAANVTVKYEVIDGNATLAGGDYVATSGTLTFLPGQTVKTITVQVKGDRVGEFQESFAVKLTDPTNADIIRNKGYGSIIDDEPRVNGFTGGIVIEGDSGTVPLTFTVTLSAPSDAPVTVNYQTADSTAVSATDYVGATGTITFAPGQTTQTFTVAVKGDLVPEPDQAVACSLTGGTNVLIVNANQAYGTIKDTDPDPTVSIANVSRAEGNPGTDTWYEFVLSLSGPSEKGVTIPFATGGGSATSNAQNRDFYADSSYVVFNGAMFTTVSVRVVGDSRSESDETFFVNLSNPHGATIADGQAVGTILNDDSGSGKTWVGPATGGLWSAASNWSPSGVPVANSLVHIAAASVTVSSSVSVSELWLSDHATLTVAPNGSRVLRTSGLFVDYQYWTVLNLNDNDMIVDYAAGAGNISPLGGWNRWNYGGIAAMVAYGNPYDGTGILTTQPDALAGLTTLGIGEASQILGITGSQNAVFSGQTVDSTTVLIRYTYRGDANLDGKINVDDYGRVDFNVSLGVTGWYNGDFNYDGKINVDDYGIIDFNVGIQGPPLGTAPATVTTVMTNGTAPLPLQSKPMPPRDPVNRDRDVVDSIFLTGDIL
jgi:Calx-beta domain/FG-GAP-like repeat/FG-GAP repeat